MMAPANIVEAYDELADESSRRSNFQKIRPPKATRTRSRRRKTTVNKVGCGFAARRNKRWTW
jgi:hypothetical protein